jgi:hypothetical protein
MLNLLKIIPPASDNDRKLLLGCDMIAIFGLDHASTVVARPGNAGTEDA